MADKVVKPQSTASPVSDNVVLPASEAVTEVPSADIHDQPDAPITEIPTDSYLTSPLFYEIANYFDIEPRDYDVAKDKLETITDYMVKHEGVTKFEDILLRIKGYESRIEKPAWGEKRYNNLYKYIRLATQRDSFSKAMRAYEKQGEAHE